jgi:hypothetical protein
LRNYIIISVFGLFIFSNLIFAEDFTTLAEKVNFYKSKYKVECVNEKITDNFGNGFDDLYGTRNMRTILFGVAYRGGANNFYHKTAKRDNHNPLPEDGLNNLCINGFSNSVYLYSTNFAESKKSFIKNNDTLHYIQNSGNERNNLRKIMLLVKKVIDNPNEGPIYLHCWNGWHQSGYVSSAILMQFCGIDNEQAYKYWIENTDGVNKGYENVKNQVKNLKIFDDITISKETRDLICPCMKK